RWPAPGCCVRTGCEGSGRGPPGVCRGGGGGYAGRSGPGGRGIGCVGGRTDVVPVCPAAPPTAGRAVAGIAGRSVFGAAGRGALRGAGAVGSGGVGVVGRRRSMRQRSVGGATRPGNTPGLARASGPAPATARGALASI